jgi:hypothetical protein
MIDPSQLKLGNETLEQFVLSRQPATWLDWWFRAQTTKVKERLTSILFEPSNDHLRDLTRPEVHAELVKFVVQCEELRNIVQSDFLHEALNVCNEEPSLQSNTNPNFCYKCGLRPGDVLTLWRELPVHDHLGNTVRVHRIGELWHVLEPSGDPTTLWLRQPDDAPHTWSDDESVFDYFQPVNR